MILAEKFLQAQDIARAVLDSIAPRSDPEQPFVGRVRGDEVHVTWANGHVLELAEPEAYDNRWGSPWRAAVLPYSPPSMDFRLIPRNERRLAIIANSMSGAIELVNACDAGREGELIFDEVLRYLRLWSKPSVEYTRMWITSTTKKGLCRAWENRLLAEGRKYRYLREAARTRSEADHLWGFNLTRYATLGLSKVQFGTQGQRISIGRVRTPVMGELAARGIELQTFKSTPYWQALVNFRGSQSGARYFESQLLADGDDKYGLRYTDFKSRDTIRERIRSIDLSRGQPWDVEESKPTPMKEWAPPAFDLISLQRSCFRIYNWSAKYTLQVAQEAYQKAKVITYPRTDCAFFPNEMQEEVFEVWDTLRKDWLIGRYPGVEQLPPLPRQDYLWFDTEKVTDHHAMMPTGIIPDMTVSGAGMSDVYKLWELVTVRFLTAFLPPASLELRTRMMSRPFEGKTIRCLLKAEPILDPGWLLFESVTQNTRGEGKPLKVRLEERAFPHCEGKAYVVRTEIIDCRSYPPMPYDYDSILSYMEKHDLGTSATRAEVLAELIDLDYIHEMGRRLMISPLGAKIFDLLTHQGGSDLLKPETTAFWEKQLELITKGSPDRQHRKDLLDNLVLQIESLGRKLTEPIAPGAVIFCPKTGQRVVDSGEWWTFPGWPDRRCWKVFCARAMEAMDWQLVLSGGKKGGGPFKFISARTQKEYRAWVVWNQKEHRFELSFKARVV